MTTYITQEQAEKLAFGFGGVVPSYRGVEKKDVYPLCNAAIQAYKETLVAGVVLPEPYGYDVYVEEADNGYIVYNLDDPQLVDDATNHDATTTTLYTADQLRQAIADADQLRQAIADDRAKRDAPVYRQGDHQPIPTKDESKWVADALEKQVPQDCRLCANYTAATGGCTSVVQCVDASQFRGTLPRRYWTAAPDPKDTDAKT